MSYEDCTYAFGRRLPKGKPLPPYAVEYFNQLVAQYLTLTDVEKQRNPQAKELAEALMKHQDQDSLRRGLLGSIEGVFGRRRRRKEGHLNWGDLSGMEMCVLRLVPNVCLDHQKCSLNARFHDLAGQDWYDLPQLSRTGPTPTEADYEDLRANLAMMLADIQRRRSLILAREMQRNFITWIGAVGAIFTVVVSLLLGVYSLEDAAQPKSSAQMVLNQFLPTCFVLLSGASGGLISMLRRLQGKDQGTDQSRDTILMEAGQSSLLLSPLYGAIFASVLYLIFRGRMLNALLGESVDPSGDTYSPLFPNFLASGLLNPLEFAKLMVWSFAAGFAEKFVPDVLDRITARSLTSANQATANKRPAVPDQEFASVRPSRRTLVQSMGDESAKSIS